MSVIVDEKSLNEINDLSGNELLASVAERFGMFKRNFFASPFEMMMNALADEKSTTPASIKNLCYSLSPTEKTWLIYNSNEGEYVGTLKNLTVYFGLSFNDKSEQQIVRILLTVHIDATQELTEAKKHINNSPVVEVTESELSKYLIDAFPQEKNSRYGFTNGITSFSTLLS